MDQEDGRMGTDRFRGVKEVWCALCRGSAEQLRPSGCSRHLSWSSTRAVDRFGAVLLRRQPGLDSLCLRAEPSRVRFRLKSWDVTSS